MAACRNGLAAFAALSALVVAAPAMAGAPPEVIIAVDTSESMQLGVGSTQAPDCTQPSPVRSRWAATLEMVLGNHGSYGCQEQSLADHPDQAAPPKQIFGAPTCIGGLSMIAALDAAFGVDGKEPQAITDPSWAGQAPSGSAGLLLQTDDADVRLPTFALDTAAVKATGDWVGGKIVLRTKDGSGLGAGDRWAVLVSAPVPASQLGSKEWVCKTNDAKRVPVSAPVKLATTGGTTVFHLNQAFAAALQSAAKAGTTTFVVAVAPAANWMSDDCSARAGDVGEKFKVRFHGGEAASADKPQFSIAVGKACPREGPGKHYQPTGGRNSNGALATFHGVAKFGLIVPDSQLGTLTDGSGGFSFGASFGSNWGDANLGAADPFANGSPSVAVARTDVMTERAAVNDKIRSTLENIQPRGGTPLGRLLEDLQAYLGPSPYQDPHFKPLSVEPLHGDPYFECRERMVLLFTDGGSNLDDGVSDGRQNAIVAATALQQLGVRLFVISVGDDGGGTGAIPQEDIDFLDQLAFAGGTGSALRAAETSTLEKHLTTILGASAIVGEVRTRTIWTESTGVKEDAQHTFYTRSAFHGAEPVRSSGIAEQRLLSCQKQCVSQADPSTARVCSVIDYADRLRQRQTPRSIFTTTQGNRLEFTTSAVTAEAMGLPTIGTAPRLRPDSSGACVSEPDAYDLSDPAQREAYRVDVVELVRSVEGTCREEVVLGAPGDSQHAVLEPAERLPLSDPIFKTYAKTATPETPGYTTNNPTGSFRRPTMVFMATHDGMLHAFRSDRDSNVNFSGGAVAGDEMWAWIPWFSTRRLRDLRLVTRAQESLLGGDIVATHTLLERKVSTVAEAALQWRAVVVVGAGEAGSGYFALDVTSPTKPRLLWEITPDLHCWGPDTSVGAQPGPNCALTGTFVNLGRSTAKPVIARAFYERDGVKAERAVAILAAGKPATASDVTNVGVDGNGKRSVFVIELASGRLIREFKEADLDRTGMVATLGDSEELGHFWSEPACYNTAPGALVSRCFLGDSRGQLWRIDLASSDPTKWTIQWFHDAYGGPGTAASWIKGLTSPDRVPALAPASIATNRAGDLLIIYGTGSVDEASTATRRHQVYSLRETFALSEGGSAARAVAERVWAHTHEPATRFIGPPIVFSGNAYWASYTHSPTGLCDVGTGRLWGADYEAPLSPSNPTALFGAFPNPASPAKPSTNLTNIIVGSYTPSPVEVTPVPACINGCAPTDYNCVLVQGGALGRKPPAFQVTVGSATSNQASGQTPSGGTAPQVGSAAAGLSAPRSTAVITGWDLLFD